MSASTLRWIAAAVVALSSCAHAEPTFPKHWGNPPVIQTRDYLPLPGGYGYGSSTLGNWIRQNLERDAAGVAAPAKPDRISAGKGVTLSGEMRQGSRVTLSLDGPAADGAKHDYRVLVRLTHKSGSPDRSVRASMAKDGRWQLRFTPEKSGPWNYRVSFVERKPVEGGRTEVPVAPQHGKSGSFIIAAESPSDR
jgi:hypothetical protein